MINFIKILRPINLFITLICILLSSLIIDDLSYSLIPFIIAILCLVGFSNILNDIFDYQIDAANNLERPIPSGAIKHWHAIIYSIALLCTSLFMIFNYNFNSLTRYLILFINLPLIIFYTPIFKKIALLGNVIVSFILSMVFIVTTTYLNGDIALIIPPALLAFLLMLIRELVKDIADLEGDKQFNVHTFPVKFGIQTTFKVIIFISFLLISIALYFTTLYNMQYFISLLLFVVLPLIYHLYEFSKNKTATYCIYLSKALKLITIFGVIVIYLATI